MFFRSRFRTVAALAFVLAGTRTAHAQSAAPSPSAAAKPAGFSVDRSHVGILPGATERVRVSGARGEVTVSAFPGVSARYDAVAHALSLTGVASGAGKVTILDARGSTVTISVFVGPPAGTIPTEVSVELAGPVTSAFVASRVREAVAALARLRPWAAVKVHGLKDALTLPFAAGAAAFDIPVTVGIDGNGYSVNASGTTLVHLRLGPGLPVTPAAVLLYSDDPEYVDSDGVVFRSQTFAAPDRPVRLYFYHAAAVEPRAFSLVLRAPAGARVALTGIAAAPSVDYLCAGHRATADYLRERRSGESSIASVTLERPFVLPLRGWLREQQLIAGVFDIAVLSGGPVETSIVSTSPGIDPLAYATTPELRSDGSHRKGEFSLAAVKPLALQYDAALAEEDTVDLAFGFSEGQAEFPNLRPGGNAVPGDYGVVRRVQLHLVNHTGSPRTAYFFETPLNGALTSTFWFDGEERPVETAPVSDASKRFLIKTFALGPNEERTVGADYMTDGGSHYPAEYGLTPEPPFAPPPWVRCAADSGPAPD